MREVNPQVMKTLRRKDLNYAETYRIWVEIFGCDCAYIDLYKYLNHNYEWTPSYFTLRRKWLPIIRLTVKKVSGYEIPKRREKTEVPTAA